MAYTRQFTAPIAELGSIDKRYCLRKNEWHAIYEKDGEVEFAVLTPAPDQSPKSILAAIGVRIEDALIEFMG